MGMSGHVRPGDRGESIATIHAALDAGITLLDTGDFYGMGHNELLIGEALKGVRRDHVQLSVKFGALRDPDGGWSGFDARPAAVKNFLAYSLQRLGVDHIDIYRPARLDPNVPIEETIGAIADMVKAGYVRHIGLSEVGAETHPPRRRRAPDQRSADRIFADLARHRGRDPADLPRAWHRRHRLRCAVARPDQRPLAQGAPGRPGFSPQPTLPGRERRGQSRAGRRLREVAAEEGDQVAQTAIAWVAAQGSDVVPLVGARRRDRLRRRSARPT